jgi:hypothetical protein
VICNRNRNRSAQGPWTSLSTLSGATRPGAGAEGTSRVSLNTFSGQSRTVVPRNGGKGPFHSVIWRNPTPSSAINDDYRHSHKLEFRFRPPWYRFGFRSESLGNPAQTIEKLLRRQSPTETPEEHFSSLLQRELTPHERHLLKLANVALRDSGTFRKEKDRVTNAQRGGPQIVRSRFRHKAA